MADRYMARRARWVLVVAIIGALSAGWLVVHRAEAGEVEKLDTSLKLIPDDAAFYSSMLRNREQVEAIAGSRAWAKLKAMPVVQMGLTMYKAQAADPESVPGKIEVALKDPQTRKLLDTAVDMLSAEIFLYGDQSFVDFMQLMQETYGSVQYGSAVAQITGQTEGLDEDKLQAKMLMAALSENPELLKVPNMVVGFKVSDKGRASEQLAMLHELGTAALEADPMMKGRLKKTSVGGHQYLTLSLDGKMIPWDEVPLDELKEMEPNEGDAEKLIARIKEMTLVISLGLRDDYLLLSVGSSTDCLAGLGQGKRLIDRPEFKPLEKFAGKRLASISYVSKPMMARLASSKQDIDDLLEAVEQVLPQTELTPEQQAQIRKDAAALAEDLKTMIPDPGALMALEFLTERGVEGYRYDWTEHPELDGSKPLGLLQHTGGNPFLAVVGRGKNSPEDYDLLVKWLKVGWRYVQEYAVPQMPEHDRKEFEQFVELVQPLLKRMDKANRTMLIPALADGQVGFVLDAKLTSKQFIQALPPTEQPMPMIEPAVVLGVSDAKLLRASFREYQAVIHGVIDAIRQIDPGTIPDDYKIPNPKVTKSASGTIYGWSLPKEWGVDKRIVPNFGLSDSVAVFSASRKHTQRLLAATPLAVGGVLVHPDRPLAVAAVFDWAGLVDAATPWVDLAVQKIIEEAQPDVEEDVIRAQVRTVLEVLKVLRKVTSESYFEGDALVTHTLVEIRDIEE